MSQGFCFHCSDGNPSKASAYGSWFIKLPDCHHVRPEFVQNKSPSLIRLGFSLRVLCNKFSQHLRCFQQVSFDHCFTLNFSTAASIIFFQRESWSISHLHGSPSIFPQSLSLNFWINGVVTCHRLNMEGPTNLGFYRPSVFEEFQRRHLVRIPKKN